MLVFAMMVAGAVGQPVAEPCRPNGELAVSLSGDASWRRRDARRFAWSVGVVVSYRPAGIGCSVPRIGPAVFDRSSTCAALAAATADDPLARLRRKMRWRSLACGAGRGQP